MRHLFLISTALVMSACQGATTTGHAHPSDFPVMTVTASGESTATPDTATISAGVLSRASTPTAAMSENSDKMDAVFAALDKAGIERKDITTSNLSLNPNYAYNRATGKQTIDGYNASNQVTVRSEDISKVGPMVDALVSVGVNNINNIRFSVKDPESARDDARMEAIAKARAKAGVMAEAAGVKLVKIRRISEGFSSPSPRPYYGGDMAMATASRMESAPPVSGGEQTINANVTLVYEIE